MTCTFTNFTEFEKMLEQNHCYFRHVNYYRFYRKIDAYCKQLVKCTAQSHHRQVDKEQSQRAMLVHDALIDS